MMVNDQNAISDGCDTVVGIYTSNPIPHIYIQPDPTYMWDRVGWTDGMGWISGAMFYDNAIGDHNNDDNPDDKYDDNDDNDDNPDDDYDDNDENDDNPDYDYHCRCNTLWSNTHRQASPGV